jgi:hypothetical protein
LDEAYYSTGGLAIPALETFFALNFYKFFLSGKKIAPPQGEELLKSSL